MKTNKMGMNKKIAMIYTFSHLPEKLMFLANPPKDITENKYNDDKYLSRVIEMTIELKAKDFDTRKDGVLPYSKKVIKQHLLNRIRELKKEQGKNKGGIL